MTWLFGVTHALVSVTEVTPSSNVAVPTLLCPWASFSSLRTSGPSVSAVATVAMLPSFNTDGLFFSSSIDHSLQQEGTRQDPFSVYLPGQNHPHLSSSKQ